MGQYTKGTVYAFGKYEPVLLSFEFLGFFALNIFLPNII